MTDLSGSAVENATIHIVTRLDLFNLQETEAGFYDDDIYEYNYDPSGFGGEYPDLDEAEYIEAKEQVLEDAPVGGSGVEDAAAKKRRKRRTPLLRHRRQAVDQGGREARRESNDLGEVQDSEENVRLLCCSFQKYLHCSESVVNTTCGYETARFTKSFLDRMSGPLIQVRPISRKK